MKRVVSLPRLAGTRRGLLKAGLAVAATLPCFARADEPAHDVTADQDFDELWETVRAHYCFFDDKRTDWNRVRALYRPQAIAAETIDDFAGVVGRVLGELYDAHTHLQNPPDGTRRWPLYDLVAEPAGADARITAIQKDSAAADAGLAIGDIVTAVDGEPMERLVRDIAPKCLTAPDSRAAGWAINVAVAGRRAHGRELAVRRKSGAPRIVALPLKQQPADAAPV